MKSEAKAKNFALETGELLGSY